MDQMVAAGLEKEAPAGAWVEAPSRFWSGRRMA